MNKIVSFDEWLINRLNMSESELRALFEKNTAYFHYPGEYPAERIAIYRRKYRREMDIIASENISYTFQEWLKVYEGHTPDSFHKMCEYTGLNEKWCLDYLIKEWEKREDLILGQCPFEN